MKRNVSMGLALATLAGVACSVATAQKSQPVVGGEAPLNARALTATKLAVHPERLYPVGQTPRPTDAIDVDIYNNGDIVAPPGANYFSFGAAVNPVIDQVSFNRGPGAGPGPGVTGVTRTVKAVTVAFATGAVAPGSASVDVRFTYFGVYNPGAGTSTTTPVANTPLSTFTVTVNQPGGGWTAGTVYLVDVDLTQAPLTIFNTINELGAVEIATLESGSPTINFLPAFFGDGNTVGDSLNTFHYDNDLNTIIAQSETYVVVSNPTDGLRPKASIVLSMEANLDVGSCCRPDGSCIIANTASCARIGGVYGGNNTDCSTASCIQPGACVIADGSCILASSTQCATLTGVYKGNGTNCANAVCSGPTTLWNNGPLNTGTTTTISGAAAPAGTAWSECPGASAACSATVAGNTPGVVGTSAFRLADDFTIPAGETWTITEIDTFAYVTGSTPTSNPFAGGGLNVQIWNGPPDTIATSIVVGGDNFTNRLTSSTFSGLYRIFFNTAGTTRPIYKNTATFNPPVVLGPGTYYVDTQSNTAALGSHFTPLVSTRTLRGTPGRNALQRVPVTVGNDWVPVEDGSNALMCGSGLERIEFPFIVRGSKTGQGPGCAPAGCYANCDGSTGTPVLTANDFQCFLNLYAAQDPVANCDGSTGTPALTANDFQCFLNEYAAGCS